MSRLLTAKQVYDLDRMNVSSQRMGGLGTYLSGGVSVPAAGSLYGMRLIKYVVAPALGTATATKAAIPLTDAAQEGITAGITQPDVPRCLSVKANASGCAGDVVIYGTDITGEDISETIALDSANEAFGVTAFATITGIDYPVETHAGTDTVSIGRANNIGLPVAVPNASVVVAQSFNGTADGGTVTADATVSKSIFAAAGAGSFNGAKLIELIILV